MTYPIYFYMHVFIMVYEVSSNFITPVLIILLEDTYFLIGNYFSIYFQIYIYLRLISILRYYYFPYMFESKRILFVYLRHLVLIKFNVLYIQFLNTYETLHDSFLINIFNNYYFPYMFVSKGILCVYLRHLAVYIY